MRLGRWLGELLLGPSDSSVSRHKLGVSSQRADLRTVWNTPSLGLTRLAKLVLCIFPFAFPVLWITELLRKADPRLVFLSVDGYVVLRAALLTALLLCPIKQSCSITFIATYFLVDILVYVSGVVFLADVYGRPLSSVRSLLLMLVNFGEVVLAFAVLNWQWGGLSVDLASPLDAFYFSAVTATTLGDGTIYPATSAGKIRVLL
ncbi:MAG: ion channel [Terriglobia bacterium]